MSDLTNLTNFRAEAFKVIIAANQESGAKKALKFMKYAGETTVIDLIDGRKATVEVYDLMW